MLHKPNLDSITVMQKSPSSKFDVDHIAYLIASKYNPGDYDYACEVQEIFEQISSMFYNKMPNSYEEIKLAENNDRQKDSL